jgi:gliding motility-associated-like protein
MYYVVVQKGEECSATSSSVGVNNSFSVKLLPEGGSFKTCSLVPFSFMVEKGNTIDHYEWIYSEEERERFESMNEDGNTFVVKRTGYYRVNVTRGMCKYQTEAKFVEYSAPDTIYVPNVFTPNSDGHNDVFKVLSSYENISLKILNRYGSEIFHGTGHEGWQGGDSPSGVYYWLATFVTCDDKRETMKGYVHLVR